MPIYTSTTNKANDYPVLCSSFCGADRPYNLGAGHSLPTLAVIINLSLGLEGRIAVLSKAYA